MTDTSNTPTNKDRLDRNMIPAVRWEYQYKSDIAKAAENAIPVTIGLLRGDEPVKRHSLFILPGNDSDRNFTYIERHVKSMLWIYGGNRIRLDAPADLVSQMNRHFQESPTGRFDSQLIGQKIYGAEIRIEPARQQDIPEAKPDGQSIGRHLNGCRIGFDLGGSDRKCAALIDGKVIFSEEIKWDPYFKSNPQYHFNGIMDSLHRAAAHLPRVDAIGGSAAGVYVDNEVRVASLFRGVSPKDFEQHVRHIFHRIRKEWNDVPFVVINDGEVTALAGAMSLGVSALLGISMGTSTAAGYVTPQGTLTSWLNELAFAPVDYRPNAPVDEWSGDAGCAVQFFSQQGVARLAQEAGIAFNENVPLPDRLVAIQESMSKGDPVAEMIYCAIGAAFGHTLAHWRTFYDLEHVLILGRVTSGAGGDLLLEQTRACLQKHYPAIAGNLHLHIPDETMKRHGQAVAAASLPVT